MNLAKCAAIVCVGATLSGCVSQRPTETRKDERTIAPTVIDKPIEGQAKWGEPLPMVRGSVLMTPLTMVNDKGWLEEKDPFGSQVGRFEMPANWSPIGVGGGSAGLTPVLSPDSSRGSSLATFSGSLWKVRWHNAAIRNLATGEEWLVLNRRGVISAMMPIDRADYSDPRTAPIMSPVSMAFLATVDDTDGDGELTQLDARVAMMTDPDGRNPRVITPPAMQVVSMRISSESGLAVLFVRRDSNGDKRFDVGDDSEPYVVDLRSSDRTARPLVSDEAKRKAEGLLK